MKTFINLARPVIITTLAALGIFVSSGFSASLFAAIVTASLIMDVKGIIDGYKAIIEYIKTKV